MPNPCLLRDWTDSLKVNALDACAERFFVRLMMRCDDYGIHPANVLLLKSGLFPLLPRISHTDIARWLAECERADLVRCYNAPNGQRYVQIMHFGQKRKYMKSVHPPPEGQIGLPLPTPEKHPRASRSRSRREEEKKHAGENHADRPTCATPSPDLEVKNGENTLKVRDGRAATSSTEPTPNYAPPVARIRREMWQLLNDEKALTDRIKDEVKKEENRDKTLIESLKSARAAIREEMKNIIPS